MLSILLKLTIECPLSRHSSIFFVSWKYVNMFGKICRKEW